MSEASYRGNDGESLYVSIEDDAFRWPETMVLHEGVLEDISTGDVLTVTPQERVGKVSVDRKTQRKYSVIRTAESPLLHSSGTVTASAKVPTNTTSLRVERRGDVLSGSNLSARRRTEHAEMVAQARAKIGDPNAAAEKLVRDRLIGQGSEVISRYLEEELGRDNVEHPTGPNGR